MSPESLNVDLDSRIKKSQRFRANSISEYFQNSQLDWWKPIQEEYLEQERLIENWLDGIKFQNGIEIGAGFGRITKIVNSHTENLILIEINQKANKYLHSQFPELSILNTQVENYDLWKGEYDIVLAIEVLVHIPDVSTLISKVSASLIDGGIFITSITPREVYGNKYTVIHRGIDSDEFEQSIVNNGLRKIDKIQIGKHLTYLIGK